MTLYQRCNSVPLFNKTVHWLRHVSKILRSNSRIKFNSFTSGKDLSGCSYYFFFPLRFKMIKTFYIASLISFLVENYLRKTRSLKDEIKELSWVKLLNITVISIQFIFIKFVIFFSYTKAPLRSIMGENFSDLSIHWGLKKLLI